MSRSQILFTIHLIFLSFFYLEANASNTQKSDSLSYYIKLISKGDQYLYDYKNDSAAYYYDQSRKYFKKKTNHKMFNNITLRECNYYRLKGKLQKAMTLLNDIKDDIKVDNQLYSEYLHQKGSIIGGMGNKKEGIKILKELINHRKKYSKSPDIESSKSLNNIGTFYYDLGDNYNALKYYKRVLSIDTLNKNISKSNLLQDIRNIGNAYLQMGNFEQALYYYNKSLKISKDIANVDDERISDIHLSLGTAYLTMGNYQKALEHLSFVEKTYIKNRGRDYNKLGNLYISLANLYLRSSDFDKAEIYLLNALRILNLNPIKNQATIGLAYNNLGKVYDFKLEYSKAVEYYKSGLNFIKDPSSKIFALISIARSLNKLGKANDSKSYYNKAIDTSRNLLEENHYMIAQVYLIYAKFLINSGELDSSYPYLINALNIFSNSFKDKSSELASAYNSLGNYYYRKNKLDKSLKYYQKALIANNLNFNDTSIVRNPNYEYAIDKSLQLSILLKKGEVILNQYQATEKLEFAYTSIDCFNYAQEAIDQLKSDVGSRSKLYLSGITNNKFDLVFNVLDLLYNKTSQTDFLSLAFKFAEKGKASILLSTIKEGNALINSNIPEELKNEEKFLTNSFSSYYNLIYEETSKQNPDSVKMANWNQNIFRLKQKHDSLINYLEHNFPDYYNLKYDFGVIPLKTVEEKLTQDELLIEFILTNKAIYRLAIEPGNHSHTFDKINIDTTFFEALRKIINSKELNIESHDTTDCFEFITSSKYLFDILFKGLNEKIKHKSLIIIPDGELGYLPFELLLTRKFNTHKINYRELPYLIKQNPISYSYSASLLFRETNVKPQSNSVLAIAPTYHTSNSNSMNIRNNYSDLVFAKREVDQISKIFKTSILKDKMANETNFKKNADSYKILHFAMHADIDDHDPMHSKLIFGEPTDSINDGFLNTYEIYGLKLNAEMAVLSACNTGGGKINKGEGIMSLARGFIYAGVPSIVMTLWNIQDMSGASIMTNFYKYLNQGLNKDVALQKAKLEYLSKSNQLYAHPYFWAAYVAIGKTNPITVNKSNWKFYILIISILSIIALTFVLKKKSE